MQFDFDKYPTLLEMYTDPAYCKAVIGPAGCLPPGSEVMTPTGWQRIESVPETAVTLVYDLDKAQAKFETVNRVQAHNTGFYRFKSVYAMDMTLSADHIIWGQPSELKPGKSSPWEMRRAQAVATTILEGRQVHLEVPNRFDLTPRPGARASTALVMLTVFGVLRQHGIKCYARGATTEVAEVAKLSDTRLALVRQWLAEVPVANQVEQDSEGRLTVTGDVVRLWATATPQDVWRVVHAAEDPAAVAEALIKYNQSNAITPLARYHCRTKLAADIVQYILTSANISVRIAPQTPDDRAWRVQVTHTKQDAGWPSLRNVSDVTFEPPTVQSPFMFCLHTSTGAFVVRQNNNVFVTGNSAKTSGIIAMAFADAIMQAPDGRGVRRTKTTVTRQTSLQLTRNTTVSVRNMIGGLGGIVNEGKPPRGGIEKLLLADGTTLNWQIDFMALDSINAATDVLGLETTNVFVDEASSVENETMVTDLLSRMGRYPSKQITATGATKVQGWMGTNGPRKGHWLHDWYLGKRADKFAEMAAQMGRSYFKGFRQPPALVMQPDGKHVPNPMAENIENLPNGYGYYYAQLIRSKSAVQAYVYGDFADIEVGLRVYQGFSALHELKHQEFMQQWGGRGPIMVSFDFGRTPVILLAVRRPTGGIVIFGEVMAENLDIGSFYDNYVQPYLRNNYPEATIAHATADPSGVDKGGMSDLSPFDQLRKRGLEVHLPASTRMDRLQPRMDAVRERLKTLDFTGRPMLQITDNCPYLLAALNSGYIYLPMAGKVDEPSDQPTKSHVGWVSDLANALEYMCFDEATEMQQADPIARQIQNAGLSLIAPRPLFAG
jgi:hypothetical protein